MKIVFVLPNISSGGAERVVTILSGKLYEKGYDVDIVLLIDDKIQYDVPMGVSVAKLNTTGMTTKNRIKTLRKYLKIEKKKQNLVVIPFQDSCLNNALAASMFLSIPVVACERNNPYRKGSGVLEKLKAELPFVLARYCVFQTYDARAYYGLVNDGKCEVIINPITPATVGWKHVYSPEKMIMVGRLHPQKNYPMLIDAMAKVREKYPTASVHVYGEGDLKEELIAYAKSKGMENAVIFEGRTNQVQQKLSESSIFLLTSNYEGLSNAMLEAMSVGMPLVCTDCPIGGARMMLDNNCGVLTPVGNVDAFTEAIIVLLSNPDQMDAIAANAKMKADLYSADSIAEKWEKVIKKITK